ncbi:C2 domain [Trypanosoma vivax]|nr:C2 domain [Trypanosoma vivax]
MVSTGEGVVPQQVNADQQAISSAPASSNLTEITGGNATMERRDAGVNNMKSGLVIHRPDAGSVNGVELNAMAGGECYPIPTEGPGEAIKLGNDAAPGNTFTNSNPTPSSAAAPGTSNLLSGCEDDLPDVGSGAQPPFEEFEALVEHELGSVELPRASIHPRHMQLAKREAAREPGRCLYPHGEEVSSELSAHNIQLHFFRAEQLLVTGRVKRPSVAVVREQSAEAGQRRLSDIKCFFEGELLDDPATTCNDSDLLHNRITERVIGPDELITQSKYNMGVSKALSGISFGDPIQMWEKVCSHSSGLASASDDEDELEKTWTPGGPADSGNELTPNMRTLSSGHLLRIECTKISNQVMETHKMSVDPLILSLAFYSITPIRKKKISEDFFFDADIDTFYPHKGLQRVSRDNHAVVFIPQEFITSIYLLVRVYRPACEDHDNYVDLYSRPDRYRNQLVAQMREEVQLLAASSEVLEEMGWNVARCVLNADGPKTIQMSKLYHRGLDDPELFESMDDEHAWNAVGSFPFTLHFVLSKCARDNVSFPIRHPEPRPEDNETSLNIPDPNKPGAPVETVMFVPSVVPTLASGFFHTYHNVYYIWLSKVNIANTGIVRKIPTTHHTFVLQIRVKNSDSSLSEEGLPLLYGNRLSSETLVSSLWSTTVHNSMCFNLNDEFKVQLPLNLTNSFHLLLTLYATEQRKGISTAEQQQQRYTLGHAVLPIFHNGVLQVRNEWEIKFVSADHTPLLEEGGYIKKFLSVPSTALVNDGRPVVSASTRTRTSVHTSLGLTARVLNDMSSSLRVISRDDGELRVSGKLNEVQDEASEDEDVSKQITNAFRNLPLAECVAFYPLFLFYKLALISSPSSGISLCCRTKALEVLIRMTYGVQQHSSLLRKQRKSSNAKNAKSPASLLLHHYLTNDLLYTGQQYRIYAGVAEVWLNLLVTVRATASGGDSSSDDQGIDIRRQMVDLAWFLFGIILRSVCVWGLENPNTQRTELFHPTLYTTLQELCLEVLGNLSGFDGTSSLVRTVAYFLRNLCNFCDRGRLLNVYQSVVSFFEERGDMRGLCTFTRIILEDINAVTMMMPSPSYGTPVFLTRVMEQAFNQMFADKDADVQASAAEMLYSFLNRVTNDSRYTTACLKWLASQLICIIRVVSLQWMAHNQLYNREPGLAIEIKRRLAVSVLWILYYTPRGRLRQWLRCENDDKTTSGFLELLSDMQTLFRYNGGVGKASPCRAPGPTQELRDWDARMSTFVTAFGSRLCSILLQDISGTLRRQRHSKHSVSFKFFKLLQEVVSLENSTVGLQVASCVLLEVFVTLHQEIMNPQLKMCNTVVGLVMSLMSSCSLHVRAIARRIYLSICWSFYARDRSLALLEPIAVSALASVAESESHSVRLADEFIRMEFDKMKVEAEQGSAYCQLHPKPVEPQCESDADSSSGVSGATYNFRVPLFLMSVERVPAVPQSLLEDESRRIGASDRCSTSFADELNSLTELSSRLFCRVLCTKVCKSMGIKEAQSNAYFKVILDLIRGGILRGSLLWLRRLYELHKAQDNSVEAGMVCLFIAGFCFRVCEAFYDVKGRDSCEVPMPFAVFTNVFWHDYVRLLPELDVMLSGDVIYNIVLKTNSLPGEVCFTAEGQVKTLRHASSLLAKDQYKPLALECMRLAERYLSTTRQFEDLKAIYATMERWCTDIVDDRQNLHNHRYFLLWARMEQGKQPDTLGGYQKRAVAMGSEEGLLLAGVAIKRVFKMPSSTSLQEFKEYGTRYITLLLGDPSLVLETDEMTETQSVTDMGAHSRADASVNRCLLTMVEVVPSLATGEQWPQDGYDRNMSLYKFECVTTAREGTPKQPDGQPREDLMNRRLSVLTLQLEAGFPYVKNALDVTDTGTTTLDALGTAKRVLGDSIAAVKSITEDQTLVAKLRALLCPLGTTRPGEYVMAVLAAFGSNQAVQRSVKTFVEYMRQKLTDTERLGVVQTNTEDYALVLKAVLDIGCALIASYNTT